LFTICNIIYIFLLYKFASRKEDDDNKEKEKEESGDEEDDADDEKEDEEEDEGGQKCVVCEKVVDFLGKCNCDNGPYFL
jgi:hypothetical protein